MVRKEESKTNCPFCGKELSVVTYYNDSNEVGVENCKQEDSFSTTEQCSCIFGNMAEQPYKIKRMCLNCSFCKDNKCVESHNLANITHINEGFDIDVTELRIKDIVGCCEYYKLNPEIFSVFMEKIDDISSKFTTED